MSGVHGIEVAMFGAGGDRVIEQRFEETHCKLSHLLGVVARTRESDMDG
jgi:hypothetical protein